jgi:hypothetical protein
VINHGSEDAEIHLLVPGVCEDGIAVSLKGKECILVNDGKVTRIPS